MTNGEGQGWYQEPERHDMARRGIKTKQPMITEEEAQKIVAEVRGKSPTHVSQAKSQMNWFEEHWISGERIPDEKLNELDVEDLQKLRKSAEDRMAKAKSAGNDRHQTFYERERDRLKEKTLEKLRDRQKGIEKDMNEIKGW